MFKKFFLPFLFLISLSACNNAEQPAVTETATIMPTETKALPTNTPKSISTETITASSPTATLPPPDNATDCINMAKFIGDVTIPDNAELNIGTAFTKIWRVENTGTCTWWSGYTLSHYAEESLSAPEFTPLPYTAPKETVDIAVELISPSIPGLYRCYFVIKNPEGLIMEIEGDSRLWLIINAVDSSSSDGGDTLPTASCAYTTNTTRQDAVLAAINAYRAENGLPPYTINQQLAQSALVHAADMACNQIFYHDGSDGSTPTTRAAATGYTGNVSENVYGSYPPITPEQVTAWWKLDQTDPRHNTNLLSTLYTEVGIGYAFFNDYGYYVVDFGVP